MAQNCLRLMRDLPSLVEYSLRVEVLQGATICPDGGVQEEDAGRRAGENGISGLASTDLISMIGGQCDQSTGGWCIY